MQMSCTRESITPTKWHIRKCDCCCIKVDGQDGRKKIAGKYMNARSRKPKYKDHRVNLVCA